MKYKHDLFFAIDIYTLYVKGHRQLKSEDMTSS